jgi:hypothetical protein
MIEYIIVFWHVARDKIWWITCQKNKNYTSGSKNIYLLRHKRPCGKFVTIPNLFRAGLSSTFNYWVISHKNSIKLKKWSANLEKSQTWWLHSTGHLKTLQPVSVQIHKGIHSYNIIQIIWTLIITIQYWILISWWKFLGHGHDVTTLSLHFQAICLGQLRQRMEACHQTDHNHLICLLSLTPTITLLRGRTMWHFGSCGPYSWGFLFFGLLVISLT